MVHPSPISVSTTAVDPPVTVAAAAAASGEKDSAASIETEARTATATTQHETQQGFFKLVHVASPVVDVSEAIDPAVAARLSHRASIYADRSAYWQTRWSNLRTSLHQRLSQPLDEYEEVRADVAIVCSRDWQQFQQNRAAHTDYRRAHQAEFEYQKSQRREEMRAMEIEDQQRRALDTYGSRKLSTHYGHVLSNVLHTDAYESALHEFELRDSLRHSTQRFEEERQQHQWLAAEQQRIERERMTREAERRRQDQQQAQRQAQQTRVLQIRTGARKKT